MTSWPGTAPADRTGAEDQARDELGAAARQLLDAVVESGAEPPLLAELAGELDRIAARLRAAPARAHVQSSPFDPHSLVGGTAHPVAPQLRLTRTADGVEGAVTLGAAFEGGPGLAHGGVLALLFDHAMGTAVFLDGHAAMTRTLDVHYLAPTRLGVPLRMTARVDRVEGRRVHVVAELTADGTPTSRATAVFVRLTEDNVAQLFSQ